MTWRGVLGASLESFFVNKMSIIFARRTSPSGSRPRRGRPPAGRGRASTTELEAKLEEAAQSDTWLWIIDPVDGTTNLAYSLPLCCVSIGLSVTGSACMLYKAVLCDQSGVVMGEERGMR